MASWQNASGKENHKSLFDNVSHDRCIFCGNHDEIKTTMTIVFSDHETNTGPICKRCYHANSRKAIIG